MSNGFFKVPVAINEPVKSYAAGTTDRILLKEAIAELKSRQLDIPMFIGGEEVTITK